MPADVLEIDEALNPLAAVDERKTMVIELRYFGGMDREEMAAALPDGTVGEVRPAARGSLAAQVSGGRKRRGAV